MEKKEKHQFQNVPVGEETQELGRNTPTTIQDRLDVYPRIPHSFTGTLKNVIEDCRTVYDEISFPQRVEFPKQPLNQPSNVPYTEQSRQQI